MPGRQSDMQKPRRLLYGRRQGHKLRAGQQHLVETLLPRLAIDLKTLGDPRRLFDAAPDDIWLEIGFGGGEHLATQAAAHPNIGFLGCEPFVNGVAKLLVQIDRAGLDNIRLHQGDARDLLDALAPGSVGRVFLLFPDPWPKTRHHKRRFVSQETLDQLAQAVRPGGELRIATDIPDYCRWTLQHIRRHGAFEWLAKGPADWRQRPADWPETRYEQKAIRQGRIPVYLRFRRHSASD